MSKSKKFPNKLKPWLEVRKRLRLSHVQIQMARELGMNPKKMGGLANQSQEPWKAPLPQFIEECYRKRFHRAQPESVFSLEELAAKTEAKKKIRKEERLRQRELEDSQANPSTDSPVLESPPLDSEVPF